mgnify:CR=1 FL=1
MATIKDVAREAGLAVGTVSRVLNNRGYISDSARKKVYEAMERLNYKPNEIARALYRKKSNIIGVVVPMVSHPFFSELVNHIEYYSYEAGYKVLICNSYSDSEKEKKYIELINRNQVDGFIVTTYTQDTSDYINSELPLVTLDRSFDGLPYITSDHYRGGTLATNLLIEKGCKKIAHLSGPLEIDIIANSRSKAFLDVVSEKKVEYIIEQTKLTTFENYKKIVYKFLEKHTDVDGIFCGSDIIATSLIHVANIMDKNVPEELKIIGYDDLDIALMNIPSLTTIRQNIEQIAERAVNVLLDKLEEKEVNMKNVLPVTLVERETT